ncbi:hypothetical protein DRW41_08740 [Neobacillus piezotolerans]|uniref:Bulb-type lectin domain-containing protein n=1 Tax=Neobacillus piezotolerans TaxID=2259171 RepID=A0A3D8GUQ6_9BACI|nr:hypothetical protein [Neobacillus piezotolerans]RDU37891.1 hypothetical protein DRW41_08740 [Neobacillus piezotolerans]
MKGLSANIIALGVVVLYSTWSISNAIISSSSSFPHHISVDQNTEGSYELIVNDGWLYLYDKSNGQIWKKQDNLTAEWERVKHYSQ